MFLGKTIACIIPARLQSSRFPQKLIAPLCGKPVIQWVWEAACHVQFFDHIVLAIDDQKTAAVLDCIGAPYIMTSKECQSGTDRLVELATQNKIKADIWVNWQGDEPFICQAMIEQLLQSILSSNEDMWSLRKRITNPNDITAPNIAKVVCDTKGFALYFSRAPIPYARDEKDLAVLTTKYPYYKHVGLYAFTTQTLKNIASMHSSELEQIEKLEQLRFLSNNTRIRMHETEYEVFGIDTIEDLHRAENRIKRTNTENTEQTEII